MADKINDNKYDICNYFPNGKQILTMEAYIGHEGLQYSLNKKNYKNVGITIVTTFVAAVLCYKIKQWYDHRSISSTENEDKLISNSKTSKTSIKDSALEKQFNEVMH